MNVGLNKSNKKWGHSILVETPPLLDLIHQNVFLFLVFLLPLLMFEVE